MGVGTDTIFQFHKGAIRTNWDIIHIGILMKNFNSIKVRLEHSDFCSQIEAHLFQFHKGAIRT